MRYYKKRMRRIGTVLSLVILILLPTLGRADSPSSAAYQLLEPVITPGGMLESDTYSLLGTFGELVRGFASSTSFSSLPGFPAFPVVSSPVVSTTAQNTSAALTWTPAVPFLGYSVSGYSVGQSTTSGGPYSFTAVGNVLSYTTSSLTNGTTYYFIVKVLDQAGIGIGTSTEVAVTPAAPAPPPSGGSGSGGSSGPSSSTGNAGVKFSGLAYPGSTVVLLKDGAIALSTIAGGDAKFSMALNNLVAGSYVFSVYTTDTRGKKSVPLSFTTTLTRGAVTEISGLFLAPTIDVDKAQVRRGDNITIFGQGPATSNIVISVHSNPELFVNAKTDQSGGYLYVFDSSPLDYGDHVTKSKAMQMNLASEFGDHVDFAVGDANVTKGPAQSDCAPWDLNCDGRVNLVDFSIMAYWWNRPLSGTGLKADQNKDGKVNLVDFSIMVYHWTG